MQLGDSADEYMEKLSRSHLNSTPMLSKVDMEDWQGEQNGTRKSVKTKKHSKGSTNGINVKERTGFEEYSGSGSSGIESSDELGDLPKIGTRAKISNSDIDLRKSAAPLIQPDTYSQPKRTVSLTQAELINRENRELEDAYENVTNNNDRFETEGGTLTTLGLTPEDRPWSAMQQRTGMDMMSERSYATTTYLRPLTTFDAKRK